MKRPPGISSKLLVGGSVSWRYRFKHGKEPDGRDRYVSKAGLDTMREAIEAMTRERARLGKPSTSSTGDVTFGEFFLQWLDYRAGYWSPKTREENRRHANRAISRFGHIPLSKITPEILDLERN